MLNSLQLKKIDKETVQKKMCDIVVSMNNHQFDKLKSKLNKMGVFDDVRK